MYVCMNVCMNVCIQYSGMIIDITHLGPIVANQHKLVPSLVLCKIIRYVWDYPKEETSSSHTHTLTKAHRKWREKIERKEKWRERTRDRYGTMSWNFFFISRDIFYMQSESVYSPLTDSYFHAGCMTLTAQVRMLFGFDEGRRKNTQSECERILDKLKNAVFFSSSYK